jgi:hypothetical protein
LGLSVDLTSGGSKEGSADGPVILISATGTQEYHAEDVSYSGPTGTAMASLWSPGGPNRTVNTGSVPIQSAWVGIGEAWQPGMLDLGATVGEMITDWYQLMEWPTVEQRFLDAGAVTLRISFVTLPSGQQLHVTDVDPTLRYVMTGQLKVGLAPAGPAATPPPTVSHFAASWVTWLPGRAQVLTNPSKAPAVFVEYSLIPAESSTSTD